MTAIVLISTFQKDRTGADQDQAYAMMSKSASIYENLGSSNDAFEPLQEYEEVTRFTGPAAA